jgi:hypothetical protein
MELDVSFILFTHIYYALCVILFGKKIAISSICCDNFSDIFGDISAA